MTEEQPHPSAAGLSGRCRRLSSDANVRAKKKSKKEDEEDAAYETCDDETSSDDDDY